MNEREDAVRDTVLNERRPLFMLFFYTPDLDTI